MASRRSSSAAVAPERSASIPTIRGTQSSGASSSSAAALPPLDDEALYEGWCAIGQPNGYGGPKDQERNDLAEGEGGKHYRRGVRSRQERLRDERKKLRRAQEEQQQQQHAEVQEPRAEKRLKAQQERRAAKAAAAAAAAVAAAAKAEEPAWGTKAFVTPNCGATEGMSVFLGHEPDLAGWLRRKYPDLLRATEADLLAGSLFVSVALFFVRAA